MKGERLKVRGYGTLRYGTAFRLLDALKGYWIWGLVDGAERLLFSERFATV